MQKHNLLFFAFIVVATLAGCEKACHDCDKSKAAEEVTEEVVEMVQEEAPQEVQKF